MISCVKPIVSMTRLVVGILLLIFSITVLAFHNPEADEDRGYNRENCLSMTSKTTGKQAEWLGHIVGCLIEDKNEDGELSYVLIEEYKVLPLTFDDATELREIAKKYTLPDEVDWNEQL